MLPTSSPRVGVCVTGEARSFNMIGARGSLALLLDVFAVQPVVRFFLATHSRLRHSTPYRQGDRGAGSSLTEGLLASEFPGAKVQLFRHSDCMAEFVRGTACCTVAHRAMLNRSVDANAPAAQVGQPVAFLQYMAVWR